MTTEWLAASIRVSGVLLGCVECGSFLLLLILLILLLLLDYRASVSASVSAAAPVSVCVYPYLYPYPWERDGMRAGEVRIIMARCHQHLRKAWAEDGWQQNVDCLVLYRPRLVRDQTPNTRRPGSQEACQERIDPHYPSSQIHVACKHSGAGLCTLGLCRSPVSSVPIPVPVPVARPVPRGRGRKEKKLLPKMDSDKTTGPSGLSGSSQCPTMLIRGLRSFPPSGGTQRAKRRGSLRKRAARTTRLARLDVARRVGASGSCAAIRLSHFPPRSNPGKPRPAIPFCRSSEIGSVGPCLSHYNPLSGTGPPSRADRCFADSGQSKLLPASTPPDTLPQTPSFYRDQHDSCY